MSIISSARWCHCTISDDHSPSLQPGASYLYWRLIIVLTYISIIYARTTSFWYGNTIKTSILTRYNQWQSVVSSNNLSKGIPLTNNDHDPMTHSLLSSSSPFLSTPSLHSTVAITNHTSMPHHMHQDEVKTIFDDLTFPLGQVDMNWSRMDEESTKGRYDQLIHQDEKWRLGYSLSQKRTLSSRYSIPFDKALYGHSRPHLIQSPISPMECSGVPYSMEITTSKPWLFALFMNGFNNLSNSVAFDLSELRRSPLMRDSEAHVVVLVKRLNYTEDSRYEGIPETQMVLKTCDHLDWVQDLRGHFEQLAPYHLSHSSPLKPLPDRQLRNRIYHRTDIWTLLIGHMGTFYVAAEFDPRWTTQEIFESYVALVTDKVIFPTEKRMLTLWGHGNMFFGMPNGATGDHHGTPLDPDGSPALDLSSQSVHPMQQGHRDPTARGLKGTEISRTLHRIAIQAPENAKLDILGFDACLMANYEMVSLIKSLVRYVIGSEVNENNLGWSYAGITAYQSQSPSGDIYDSNPISSKDMIRQIVNSYAESQIHNGRHWSLVGLDMGYFSQFVQVFDDAIALARNCQGPDTLGSMLDHAIGHLDELEDCYRESVHQCHCWDLKQLLISLQGHNETDGDLTQAILRSQLRKALKLFAHSVVILRQKDDAFGGAGYGIIFNIDQSLGGVSIFYPADGTAPNDRCGDKTSQTRQRRQHSTLSSAGLWMDIAMMNGQTLPGSCSLSYTPSSEYPDWPTIFESYHMQYYCDINQGLVSPDIRGTLGSIVQVDIAEDSELGDSHAILRANLFDSQMKPMMPSRPVITVSSDAHPYIPLGILWTSLPWCHHRWGMPLPSGICNLDSDALISNVLLFTGMIQSNSDEAPHIITWPIVPDDKGLGHLDLSSDNLIPAILVLTSDSNSEIKNAYHWNLRSYPTSPLSFESLIRLIPYDPKEERSQMILGQIPLIDRDTWIHLDDDPSTIPKISTDSLLSRLSGVDPWPPFYGLQILLGLNTSHQMNQNFFRSSPLRRLDPLPSSIPLKVSLSQHFPTTQHGCSDPDRHYNGCCTSEYIRYEIPDAETILKSSKAPLFQEGINNLTLAARSDLFDWANSSEGANGDTIGYALCLKPSRMVDAICIPSDGEGQGTLLCVCDAGYDGVGSHCVRRPSSSRFTVNDGVPSFALQLLIVDDQTSEDVSKSSPSSIPLLLMILIDGLFDQEVDRCALQIDSASWVDAQFLHLQIDQPYKSKFLLPFIGEWARRRACKAFIDTLFQDVTPKDMGLERDQDLQALREALRLRFIASGGGLKSQYKSGFIAANLFRWHSFYPPRYPRHPNYATHWVSNMDRNEIHGEDSLSSSLLSHHNRSEGDESGEEKNILQTTRKRAYVTLHGPDYATESLGPVVVHVSPYGIWWRRIILWQMSFLPETVVTSLPTYVWIIILYLGVPSIIILTVEVILLCIRFIRRRSSSYKRAISPFNPQPCLPNSCSSSRSRKQTSNMQSDDSSFDGTIQDETIQSDEHGRSDSDMVHRGMQTINRWLTKFRTRLLS